MTFNNTGHGHVTPRLDGCKARCGGPALCVVCQREAAQQLGECQGGYQTLEREVADLRQQLAYHEAQDGLLGRAILEADRLRAELAEVKRPLDEQMARLNANLTAANERVAELESEHEVRGDGTRVRKDRWETGVRRIVALLWGNRFEFEIDEVVERVRLLATDPHNDDETLVKVVLDR